MYLVWIIIGIRRYLLKKRLYEQMVQEVIKEESQQLPVEEYCTEYDGNFNADGFQPNENEYKIDSEVDKQYFYFITHLERYYFYS